MGTKYEKNNVMKKILTLALAVLLLAGTDVMAQNKPKGGKKKPSPFIEGRQKVRQDDYDSIWRFTNFSTKDTKIYYLPYDYAQLPAVCGMRKPDFGDFEPVVNYLQKSTRATLTMCAVFAINPSVEAGDQREHLAESAREQALQCIQAFDKWRVRKEMRNKITLQVAEVDYKYFKGSDYVEGMVTDPVVRVGMLLYFGTKKKPIFTVETEARTFADIRFFPNDATIVESWLPAIDTLATYLKENERKSVLLTGYADN